MWDLTHGSTSSLCVRVLNCAQEVRGRSPAEVTAEEEDDDEEEHVLAPRMESSTEAARRTQFLHSTGTETVWMEFWDMVCRHLHITRPACMKVRKASFVGTPTGTDDLRYRSRLVIKPWNTLLGLAASWGW